MAVANAYNQKLFSNTLPIPGIVRTVNYGTVNLGFGSNPPSFGERHGEIIDGPQDESMGVANYTPIIQNMCVQYYVDKKRVAMQGELVPLYGLNNVNGYFMPQSHAALRHAQPAAIAAFNTHAEVETKINLFAEDVNGFTHDINEPTMILPLASDFELDRPEGQWKTGYAAFAIQAVSDVRIPITQKDRVRAYPGDRLYVSYSTAGGTQLHNSSAADRLFLGLAVLGFDSLNDSQIKVCL